LKTLMVTTIAIGLPFPRRFILEYSRFLFISFIIVFAIIVDKNYFGCI